MVGVLLEPGHGPASKDLHPELSGPLGEHGLERALVDRKEEERVADPPQQPPRSGS